MTKRQPVTARVEPGGIVYRAPAKVNLCLDVLRRRPDGYHDLVSVMQALELHDRVALRPGRPGSGPRLEGVAGPPPGAGGPLPPGEENSAVRVLRLLEQRLGRPVPVLLHLEKRIPVAAGLGGGSSDAAASLVGTVRLLGLPLPEGALLEVAAAAGSDVPFFVRGGTCLAEGRGEVLTPLAFPGRWPVVLARPPQAVSTAEVYRRLDLRRVRQRPDAAAMARALARGDFAAVCAALGNVLETVTLDLCPAAAALKRRFRALGAPGCLMSGSGPTVFALARDEEEAAALAAGVADLAAWVAVTAFSPDGVRAEPVGG